MAKRQDGTSKSKTKGSTNGANLGFEAQLWEAADKLRNNMDAAEYKHVVLGLIFLKYISDAFQEKFDTLKADNLADPEDRDECASPTIQSLLRFGRHVRPIDELRQSPTATETVTGARPGWPSATKARNLNTRRGDWPSIDAFINSG